MEGPQSAGSGVQTDLYSPSGAEAAQAELEAFAGSVWGNNSPTLAAAWRRAWDKVIPFFAFPPEVRKAIYTTNASESVNARLCKVIKTRRHFHRDEAATKLTWLALRTITADWGRPVNARKVAMNLFAILYEDRLTRPVYSRARWGQWRGPGAIGGLAGA